MLDPVRLATLPSFRRRGVLGLVHCGALAGFLLLSGSGSDTFSDLFSRCCGALLVALLPAWLRVAGSKLRWWAAAGEAAWARLCLTMAWFALANILVCGLLWQSFVLVRGITLIVLIVVMLGCDAAEQWLLRKRAPTVVVATEPAERRAPDVAAFAILGSVVLALVYANAPGIPVWEDHRLETNSTDRCFGTCVSSFRVWSWNIQRGFALGSGLNMLDVADFAQEVDLLALQESEAHGPLTGARDVAGYVGATTHHRVVYGLDPLLADFDGTAVLSKFPVLSHQAWPLYHYFIFPVFTCTEVRVLLAPPSTALTLINVHPTLTPEDMQVSAVEFLVGRVRRALAVGNGVNGTAPAAVIVAGDLNIGPEDPMLDEIYALGLVHVFHPNRTEASCQQPLQTGGLGRCAGASYDTTRPMSTNTLTPDHIFFTPSSLELVQASALWETDHISDHLALAAEFRLRQE